MGSFWLKGSKWSCGWFNLSYLNRDTVSTCVLRRLYLCRTSSGTFLVMLPRKDAIFPFQDFVQRGKWAVLGMLNVLAPGWNWLIRAMIVAVACWRKTHVSKLPGKTYPILSTTILRNRTWIAPSISVPFNSSFPSAKAHWNTQVRYTYYNMADFFIAVFAEEFEKVKLCIQWTLMCKVHSYVQSKSVFYRRPDLRSLNRSKSVAVKNAWSVTIRLHNPEPNRCRFVLEPSSCTSVRGTVTARYIHMHCFVHCVFLHTYRCLSIDWCFKL